MRESLAVDDGIPNIRVITLNRPERLNALDGPTLEALEAAVKECSQPGRDVRVIVIRGSGRAFCAGSDLKWLAGGVLSDVDAHQRHQDLMQRTFELLEFAPQIVVAAVHGYAVAGGLELALACDLIVAAEDAQFGDEHIRRNLLPSGGSSQRLPRKIGLARAMYYLVTGRRMNGREAERLGLVSVAVPGDELDHATLEMASEIAHGHPLALSSMKVMARRSMELPIRDGLWFERWTQLRYRNASSALADGVSEFVAPDKGNTESRGTGCQEGGR